MEILTQQEWENCGKPLNVAYAIEGDELKHINRWRFRRVRIRISSECKWKTFYHNDHGGGDVRLTHQEWENGKTGVVDQVRTLPEEINPHSLLVRYDISEGGLTCGFYSGWELDPLPDEQQVDPRYLRRWGKQE